MAHFTSLAAAANAANGDTLALNGQTFVCIFTAGQSRRWNKVPVATYELPAASDTVLGGIKKGSGPIAVASDGTLNVDALSSTAAAALASSAAAVGAAAQTTADTAVTNAAAALTAANARVHSIERDGNSIVAKDVAGATLYTLPLGDLAVDVSADNISIDGNFVMTIAQTNGGGSKTIDLRTLKPVNTTHSIEGDGDSASIKLVGDAANPGAGKFYGTDGAGAKGYQTLPSISTVFPSITAYEAARTAGTVKIGDRVHDSGVPYEVMANGASFDLMSL